MASITWLHLSDYHWGEKGQSFDRERSTKLLLQDVKHMVDTYGPVDAIFFTGDLVWSGKQAEYNEAAKFLDKLLCAAGNISRERLFLVPGNHDLDRDRITSTIASLCAGLVPRDQSEQERVRKTVNDLLGPDVEDRRRVLAKLDNFFQFVTEYLGWSMDAEHYFAVRHFAVKGKDIAVIALNSAWMSPILLGGAESDFGNLLLGERQIEDALSTETAERADLCIALLHHPLSWLQPGDQSTAKARLYRMCKFILHGHLHEQAIENIITPDGRAVIIPGGACYNRVPYPNSYNLVQLDMDTWTVTIRFRRYFHEGGGRWAADTGLYDNAPQGEYTFNMGGLEERPSLIIPPRPGRRPGRDHLVTDVEQTYLRYLVGECSRVPLSPVDPKFVSIAGQDYISLGKVYVPISVSNRAGNTQGETRTQAPLPVLRAIIDSQKRRLILLGEPGSGKSTLVNYLTYCLGWLRIEPKDEEEKQTQSEIIKELTENGWLYLEWRPLRIILGKMVESGVLAKNQGGTAASVWEFLRRDIERHIPDGEAARRYQTWLFQILNQEGGLVMFDGLDEVPLSLRLPVKRAIEDFAQTLPHVCVLVTCRPYAYQDPMYQLADFQVLDLCRFNPKQIETFVQRWYKMLASASGKDLQWEQTHVQSLMRALKDERLADLASRPLLLTLMATLHSAWGTLPPDRAKLYEESVELLLARWQISKEPVHGGLAQKMQDATFRQHVRRAIEEVAYKLHVRQGEEAAKEGKPASDRVEGDLLLAALARRVEQPGEVLKYIRDRAGLLLPSGGDDYVFPHRSFQEYLAVSHLFNSPSTASNLAKLVRSNPEWWREPFLLAVGRAAGAGVDYAVHIVNTLCPYERSAVERASDEDWQAAEIAGAALVEIQLMNRLALDETYYAVLDRVRRWLVACLEEGALTPIKRASAGNVLAQLGDPRPGVGVKGGLPDILWCEVPAGEFIMGNNVGEPEERPQHIERTGRYYIARYPITNAQFQTFVEAEDGYRNDDNWTREGLKWRGDRRGPDKYGGVFDLPNHPAVMISWYEAVAFCRWLTRRMRNGEWPIVNGQFAIQVWRKEERRILQLPVPEGYVVRLPTQAEFEKAARGVDGRTYPWGEGIDVDRANFDETGIGATCAVGIFPRGESPYGVMDMSGNAWSWCGTRWQDDYQSSPDERSDLEGEVLRMVRGGGFTSYYRWLWCSYRRRHFPGLYHYDDGFRIVLAEPVE